MHGTPPPGRIAWLASVLLAICLLRGLDLAGEGFAFNQAGSFLVGIGSCYGWKHAEGAASLAPPAAARAAPDAPCDRGDHAGKEACRGEAAAVSPESSTRSP